MSAKFRITLARTRNATVGSDPKADMRWRLERLKAEGEMILGELDARFDIDVESDSATIELDDAHSAPVDVAQANALLARVLNDLDLAATSRKQV